jgi:hypothetical protein
LNVEGRTKSEISRKQAQSHLPKRARRLHDVAPVRTRGLAILLAGLGCFIFGSRPEARAAIENTASATMAADVAATHELLEGIVGRRVMWTAAPTLLIETSVMDFASGSLSTGFVATADTLSDEDVAELTADLTDALNGLTAGTLKVFRAVTIDATPAGEIVKVLRAGHIVVGRFHGVRAKTGNLGYGGRMTRNGMITQAAVVLDEAFDSQSSQRTLLRTHELGHALGFNHVESRPSVMNPRVGNPITAFDREAIRTAFLEAEQR